MGGAQTQRCCAPLTEPLHAPASDSDAAFRRFALSAKTHALAIAKVGRPDLELALIGEAFVEGAGDCTCDEEGRGGRGEIPGKGGRAGDVLELHPGGMRALGAG